ncbi:hypothetical protein [Streptomyces sp. NPDC088755]|uniref:hypothetical protein n=1 Tax=Streptomyces sp. NPDC088755 TaxID=3365888 RepID=UPI00380B4B8D
MSTDDEAILLAECGQTCVDDYRAARSALALTVIDWAIQNGGQIILDVLGVTDAKRCFADGDVESCLWTVVNAAALVAVVGKLPAFTKGVVAVSSGITKFFERAEWAKRTVERLRQVITLAKKLPKSPCTDNLSTNSGTARFTLASESPKTPCISLLPPERTSRPIT